MGLHRHRLLPCSAGDTGALPCGHPIIDLLPCQAKWDGVTRRRHPTALGSGYGGSVI